MAGEAAEPNRRRSARRVATGASSGSLVSRHTITMSTRTPNNVIKMTLLRLLTVSASALLVARALMLMRSAHKLLSMAPTSRDVRRNPVARIGGQIKPRRCASWSCEPDCARDDGRAPLPSEMRPYFNFTPALQTDLKILVMGDSVGIQLADYLRDLLRVGIRDGNSTNSAASVPATAVLARTIGRYRGTANVHVTAPLVPPDVDESKGRGAIAGYRVIGMFLPEYYNWAPANYNKGWMLQHVEALRGYVSNATSAWNTTQYTASQKNITLKNSQTRIVISSTAAGNFDVLVFRVMSPGWIPLTDVTEEALTQTIELANQFFGIRIVVFVSMHQNNNVKSQQMREEVDRRNQMMFKIAHNWTDAYRNEAHNNNATGVHTVYVLDLGRLHDELVEWNARLIGFDTSTEGKGNNGTHYLDIKLQGKFDAEYSRKIGQVCGEKVPSGSETCLGNSISRDGMHLCMNTLGPRFAAGLTCQLQCAYRPSTGDVAWNCAEECNHRYMKAANIV